MRVEIVRGLERFAGLSGAAVIFDVFRASNTIIALLAAGAARVVLLADLDEARRLGAEHPDWLLLGERGGRKVPGFAGDNSPSAASRLDLTGRVAILTTSAGTQGVHLLTAAEPVFFASFANLTAVAEALAALKPEAVHLLPMGRGAAVPAAEDDLAAEFLAARLAGRGPDFGPVAARLAACEGAERLRGLGLHDDLAFCTTLDSHRVAPWVRRGQGYAWAEARAARGIALPSH